jgi:hypothetical protein
MESDAPNGGIGAGLYTAIVSGPEGIFHPRSACARFGEPFSKYRLVPPRPRIGARPAIGRNTSSIRGSLTLKSLR